MANPVYPERPEWLTEEQWGRLLEHVRYNRRLDDGTRLPGTIGSAFLPPRSNHPEEIWSEAWDIAIIQSGELAKTFSKKLSPASARITPNAKPVLPSRRRRGRPGNKTKDTATEMRKLDPAVLVDMKLEELNATFGPAALSTCEEARKMALSQIFANSSD